MFIDMCRVDITSLPLLASSKRVRARDGVWSRVGVDRIGVRGRFVGVSLGFVGQEKVKVGIGGQGLVMVGIGGHFVVVAEDEILAR